MGVVHLFSPLEWALLTALHKSAVSAMARNAEDVFIAAKLRKPLQAA